MTESLFEKHAEVLRLATAAIHDRTFWTPYPEAPSRSVYGDGAPSEGLSAFTALLAVDSAELRCRLRKRRRSLSAS